MAFDLSVYAVTAELAVYHKHGHHFFSAIQQAICGGITMVQIRLKDGVDGKDMFQYVLGTMALVREGRGEALTAGERALLASNPELRRAMDALQQGRPAGGYCSLLRCVVNDRVDVAIAAGADGVHVGQSDLPAAHVRRLLDAAGPGKILGVTARTRELAIAAVKDGADYIGAGAVFATSSKDGTLPLPLPELAAVCAAAHPVPVVAIGGINASNAAIPLLCRQLSDSTTSYPHLPAGVAAIGGVFDDVQIAARTAGLARVIYSARPDLQRSQQRQALQLAPLRALHGPPNPSLNRAVCSLIASLRTATPLVQCMTNAVSMDLVANVLLAAGASPAMVSDAAEAPEFAAKASALLLNLGTLNAAWVPVMHAAAKAAQAKGRPVVLDPVGCGGTAHRTAACVSIAAMRPTVIRGNGSEILALHSAYCKHLEAQAQAAGAAPSTTDAPAVAGRGVDSLHSSSAAEGAARALSAATGAIVAISGAVDVIVGCGGREALYVHNSTPLLTSVTAAGCALTALIAAFCAAAKPVSDAEWQELRGMEGAVGQAPIGVEDPASRGNMLAVTAGFALFAVAAEVAMEAEPDAGPATLRLKLVDGLYSQSKAVAAQPQAAVEHAVPGSAGGANARRHRALVSFRPQLT